MITTQYKLPRNLCSTYGFLQTSSYMWVTFDNTVSPAGLPNNTKTHTYITSELEWGE